MMERCKFRDLEIGEHFHGWGDLISNYDTPRMCLFRKVDEDRCVEIEDGEESQTNLIDGGMEVMVEKE